MDNNVIGLILTVLLVLIGGFYVFLLKAVSIII
jgi:hypothetical protein